MQPGSRAGLPPNTLASKSTCSVAVLTFGCRLSKPQHCICLVFLLLSVLAVSACDQPDVPVVGPIVPVLSAQTTDASTLPDDATGSDATTSDTLPPVRYPLDKLAPAVVIQSPNRGTQTPAAAIEVQGQASDDTAVAAVTLQVGPNQPEPINWLPAEGRFSGVAKLAPGTQTLRLRAIDPAGNVGEAKVQVTRIGGPTDNAPPTLNVLTPVKGFEVAGNSVWVSGTATDDVAVASVTVQVGAGKPTPALTSDWFGHWVLEASFASGGDQVVKVVATDTAGKSSEAVIKGGTTLVFDTQAPDLHIVAPKPGLQTEADLVVVKGTAGDASGIAAVDVRVGKGPYQATTSGDGWATWQATVPLWPGTNVIRARARDKTGLVTTSDVNVVNTTDKQWTDPVALSLQWKPPTYPSISLTLDRAGVEALFTPAKAAQITLMKLDVSQLIAATFNKIRNACGSGWHKPNTLYKNCPKSWGQPEINLWRLVTMTPANVNVVGTSIEGMKEMGKTLANWGLMDDFDDVLAASLGINKYALIVGDKAVAEAMVADVMATHPNALPDGRIPVTLQDGLSDLKSMGARYDAAGKHPGFLDKNKPPYAKVLTDSFQMTMTADSNLAWHDGVRLGGSVAASKSYIALVVDKTGPTYDDVLEFEFLDPKKFQIDGLAAKPTTNITMKVTEHPSWAKIGSSRFPLPKGNGAAWKLDKWLLEYTLADAAWRFYKNHRAGCDYCKGSSSGALLYEVPLIGLDEAEIVVGRQGYRKGSSGSPENFSSLSPNPAGWMRIWTLFGLGSPPKPQYVWDMILEVSQRRLLDGGVGQGKGNARFSLQNVPVGITASSMKAALIPALQQQKAKLSTLLMGKATQAAPLDFWLMKGNDGELRLAFVAATDPVPKANNQHAKRGFYAEAALKHKYSSTKDGGSGDSTHEKLAVGDGPKTVYCMDSAGGIYRLGIGATVGDTLQITVRKSKSGGTP